MLPQNLVHRLGNQRAIDNARMSSTELSRLRVEREAVEHFLERLEPAGRARRMSSLRADGVGRTVTLP